MPTTMLDLWPSEINIAEDGSPPVVILRQQAALLAEKTNDTVKALVETSPETKQESTEDPLTATFGAAIMGRSSTKTVKTGGLVHSLYLLTPAVEDYRYRLLSVTHRVIPYPVHVRSADVDTECADEAEFISVLKSIFYSERTLRVIQTLVAQSIK